MRSMSRETYCNYHGFSDLCSSFAPKETIKDASKESKVSGPRAGQQESAVQSKESAAEYRRLQEAKDIAVEHDRQLIELEIAHANKRVKAENQIGWTRAAQAQREADCKRLRDCKRLHPYSSEAAMCIQCAPLVEWEP